MNITNSRLIDDLLAEIDALADGGPRPVPQVPSLKTFSSSVAPSAKLDERPASRTSQPASDLSSLRSTSAAADVKIQPPPKTSKRSCGFRHSSTSASSTSAAPNRWPASAPLAFMSGTFPPHLYSDLRANLKLASRPLEEHNGIMAAPNFSPAMPIPLVIDPEDRIESLKPLLADKEWKKQK
ncbi:hypothetical protein FQN54_002808 [Arachnomyces sp. PD_36]|nr:hypothetical protein FQN54_002808 [Arachnomyces sp. PD_36]